MNRFFVSFAAIVASGVFAFSYIMEWYNHAVIGQELILKPTEKIDYPYYHESESLYLTVMLIVGLYFMVIFFLTIVFSFRQRSGWIYLCFVFTMLGILGIMINGAIK
jgi:hypothetical protein